MNAARSLLGVYSKIQTETMRGEHNNGGTYKLKPV